MSRTSSFLTLAGCRRPMLEDGSCREQPGSESAAIGPTREPVTSPNPRYDKHLCAVENRARHVSWIRPSVKAALDRIARHGFHAPPMNPTENEQRGVQRIVVVGAGTMG